MAKKSLKLSKNAIMLMCSIILITLVVLVFIILKYDDRQIEKPEVKSEQLSSLVVEMCIRDRKYIGHKNTF